MDADVTLIVPVYNAERWLRDCLESIAAQTHRSLRVIVVDDESTDGSREIARAFCQSDSRFELVEARHGGVSRARNIGIDMTTSEYIGFVDADDLLYPYTVARLLETLAAAESQVAVADFRRSGNPGRDFVPKSDLKPIDAVDIEIYDYPGAMKVALYQKRIFNNPWSMLMERRLLGDDIRFREGLRYEDLDAFYRFYEQAERIAFLPEPLYYYRQDEESFIHRWSDARLDVLDVTDRIVEYMSERYPEVLPAALDRRFSAHFNMLITMRKQRVDRPEARERCLKIIKEGRKRALSDPHVRLKNKLGALLSFLFC